MEIRTLTQADVDAAADLTARVFAADGQYDEYFALSRAANLSCPFTPPELCYGMFDAGHLVAKWQLVDLSVRVLGVAVRAAGSMAIAAEPAFRKPDAIARLEQAGHAEVHALGFDLVLGVAQRGSIYRRLGAVPICAEPLWEVDPLHVPAPRVARFRDASSHDVASMTEIYNQDNAARSGTLVRSTEMYAFLPRRAPTTWLGTDGYVGVRVLEDALEVREVAGLHEQFHDAALRELAQQARERGMRRVFGHVPSDHPLVLASSAYGASVSVQYPRASGCMAVTLEPGRLLTRLAPALEARIRDSGFRDARIDLTLHVDGVAHALQLNAAAARTQKLALEVSKTVFVQLVFGYLPASALLSAAAGERGVVRASSSHAERSLLHTLFAQPVPFMWHTDRF